MSARHVISSALALVAFAATTAHTAFALPLGDGQFNAKAPRAGVRLEVGDVDFTAIVALSDCSGSYVRFNDSLPTDKGMVLTNGHCYENGFLEPGEVVVNHASTRTFRLLNADASSTLATLRAAKVMFATMTDTDITLYQLTQTYADIEARYHVQALTLSDAHPDAATPIRVVSGYWKKIYSCKIDDMVFSLHEAEWIFKDSIRYTSPGCETVGGTSGSPIIHADTHEVIGINNTGNENGERCTMNNPCEVLENGQVTVRNHASYGQQTYNIYGCLDASREIDLHKVNCALPKPATVID